jgi:hypothetical protein
VPVPSVPTSVMKTLASARIGCLWNLAVILPNINVSLDWNAKKERWTPLWSFKIISSALTCVAIKLEHALTRITCVETMYTVALVKFWDMCAKPILSMVGGVVDSPSLENKVCATPMFHFATMARHVGTLWWMSQEDVWHMTPTHAHLLRTVMVMEKCVTRWRDAASQACSRIHAAIKKLNTAPMAWCVSHRVFSMSGQQDVCRVVCTSDEALECDANEWCGSGENSDSGRFCKPCAGEGLRSRTMRD